jgi:hypothetical protein
MLMLAQANTNSDTYRQTGIYAARIIKGEKLAGLASDCCRISALNQELPQTF